MTIARLTRRRAGLFLLAATLSATRAAHAQDEVHITIAADAPEIITTDLKRLRLTEPAKFVFVKANPERFQQLYAHDAAFVLSFLQFAVSSAARRIFGEMPSAEVLRGDGAAAFVALVNRNCEPAAVALSSHTMRFELVPPL